MKVCFFGIYDKSYPRNKVLIEGLILNGYEVIECNVNPRLNKGLKKYWLLAKEKRALKKHNFEFVVVAFPGHTCVWLAKILFPKTPIVFDVFLSLYEANVSDRKVHSAHSIKGLRDYFLDWHSVRLADIVVMDTYSHAGFFEQRYGLDAKKVIRVFIGSMVKTSDYENIKPPASVLVVHFHGSFIPQHGIEYIIAAAKILESEKGITFSFIGDGQVYEKMLEYSRSLGLRNVSFVGRLPFKETLEKLAASDIALGVFGKAARAQWVIMNKIFESMALGKALISADTPALRELFTDRENVLFCEAGNPADLAAKILELKRDKSLREKIGRNSLRLFQEELSPEKLLSNFLIELHEKI